MKKDRLAILLTQLQPAAREWRHGEEKDERLFLVDRVAHGQRRDGSQADFQFSGGQLIQRFAEPERVVD